MNLLTTLIVVSLVSTALVLGWGIVSMTHGGAYDSRHSTQLMSARIGFQALAVVLLFVAMIIQLS